MAKTNQQIIVTEGDFGVEILTQLIDANKKPVPIEGCSCKIKFAYDGNVISEKTGIVIDEPKGIVSVILDKEETQYSGLWTSYWICYDQFNNITTTENIYYYVQPSIGSVNNPAFTELLNYYNRDEVNDMFKNILEQLNNYTLSKDDVEEYIKIYAQDKIDDDFIRQCVLDAIGNGSDYAKKQDVTVVSNNLYALSQRVDRYKQSLEQEDINLSNNIQTVQSNLNSYKTSSESAINTMTKNISNISSKVQVLDKIRQVKTASELKQALKDYKNSPGVLLITNDIELSEVMYIPSNVVIKGINEPVISRASGSNINGLFISYNYGDIKSYNGAKNITIEGITFYGKGATNELTLLAFSHGDNILVQRCKFTDLNAWHMIELSGVKNSIIRDCHFSKYGTAVDNATEAIQLDYIGSEIQFPWHGGYDDTACSNILIDNNVFEDIDATAIGNHSFKSGVSSNKIIITRNYFKDINVCVNLNDVSELLISSNKAEEINHFFYTQNINNYMNHIKVIGNMASGNYRGTCRGDYRFVTMNPQGFKNNLTTAFVDISHNKISDFDSHGIGITAYDVKIIGNELSNIYKNGVYHFGGTSAVIANNTFSDCAQEPGDRYSVFVGNNPSTASSRVSVIGNTVRTNKGFAFSNNIDRCLFTGNIGIYNNVDGNPNVISSCNINQ